MIKTTFSLSEHPSVQADLAGMSLRTSTGELQPTPHSNGHIRPVKDPGGSGLFSCPTDYIKILVSLLRNDGKLLKPVTVAQLFEPQLGDQELKDLHETAATPEINACMTHGMDPGKQWNHSLGGLLAMEETPGRRSKGTLTWSGYPNPAWVSLLSKFLKRFFPLSARPCTSEFRRYEAISDA